MKYSIRKYTTLLSASLLLSSVPQAWSDEITQVLEQEAAKVDVDAASVEGSSRAIASYHSDRYEQFMAQRKIVPSSLSQQDFKLYLFNEFYETYANYTELSKQQQEQVYQFYKLQDGAQLAAIDSKIQQLLPAE